MSLLSKLNHFIFETRHQQHVCIGCSYANTRQPSGTKRLPVGIVVDMLRNMSALAIEVASVIEWSEALGRVAAGLFMTEG